jgi:hypothetical protein
MKEKELIDRQEFLKKAGLGLCGCTAVLHPASALAQELQQSQLETPLDERMQHAHRWLKRFFDVFDKELDEPIRKRVMRENGRVCYRQNLGQPRPPVPMEEFVKILQKHLGKENCWMDGKNVYFNYVSNSRGLRKEKEYCLCPMVEKGPEGLSGTYCECSIGYVRVMFSSSTEQQVEVELLESLKRGGKRCRFRITIV